MTTQVQQWLEEMIETTNAIINIDLEEEANVELLLFLQNKQSDIRVSIDQYMGTHQHSYNEKEKQLIGDCLMLEMHIANKFRELQLEATHQLSRVQSGKRSRNAYQGDEIQPMGYFIDKHR